MQRLEDPDAPRGHEGRHGGFLACTFEVQGDPVDHDGRYSAERVNITSRKHRAARTPSQAWRECADASTLGLIWLGSYALIVDKFQTGLSDEVNGCVRGARRYETHASVDDQDQPRQIRGD